MPRPKIDKAFQNRLSASGVLTEPSPALDQLVEFYKGIPPESEPSPKRRQPAKLESVTLKGKWAYFENEGAYYRSRIEDGFAAWIDDLWTPDGWQPYRGDKGERYSTATPIPKDQLPKEAQAAK